MKYIILSYILVTSCSLSKFASSSFENGNIDAIWKTTKLTQGGWEVQRKNIRSGKYAIKLSLKKGMKEELGANGNTTERIELKEDDQYHASLEMENHYKFSFYIPKEFSKVSTRIVLGQWKQEGKNNPLVAQRYKNGIFYVTVSNPKGKKTILKLSLNESQSLIGRWVDADYKIMFSKTKGYAHIKIDKFQAQYSGPLAFPSDNGRIYFKFGLYRDQIDTPMTIFFDDYVHFVK
jgi:hypothetical protein